MSDQESGGDARKTRDVVISRDGSGAPKHTIKMYVPNEHSVISAMTILSRVSDASERMRFSDVLDDVELLLNRFVGPLFTNRADRREVEARMLGGEDVTMILIAAITGDCDPSALVDSGEGNREQRRATNRRRSRNGNRR